MERHSTGGGKTPANQSAVWLLRLCSSAGEIFWFGIRAAGRFCLESQLWPGGIESADAHLNRTIAYWRGRSAGQW